jgi:hypothetical protein
VKSFTSFSRKKKLRAARSCPAKSDAAAKGREGARSPARARARIQDASSERVRNVRSFVFAKTSG